MKDNYPAILGGDKIRNKNFKPRKTINNDEINSVSEVLKSDVLSAFIGAPGEKFLGGKKVQEYLDQGINYSELQSYKPLEEQIVKDKKIEKHFLGYYIQWVPQENYYYACKYTDFDSNNFGRSEGTYTKYASLDDKLDGLAFYLSYIKFGLGRCSRDAQQDIRMNHITREEGVRLVHLYDGEFPKKYFKWYLDYLEISEEFFWKVIDFYRSKSQVWEKKANSWKLKYIVK